MANDVKTWVELNLELLAQARALINATAEPSNIWRGAKLDASLANVDDDVIVADGVTRAQVMAIAEMWGSFKYWIGTPMIAFTALFGLVPLLQAYATAVSDAEAAANTDDKDEIERTQAVLDEADSALLEAARNVARSFDVGGDTPFNVIFGVN